MDDGLFKIHLNNNNLFNIMVVHGSAGIKHYVMSEKSSMF